MNKRRAIVLHQYSLHKYGVLDELQGRIDLYSFNRTLVVASMIQYQTFKTRHELPVIEQVNVQQMPLELGRQDLLFIHHVIELCVQFIPVGSMGEELFEFLQFLYAVDHEWHRQHKKLFVLKLLTMIGYYPEHNVAGINNLLIKNSFILPSMLSSAQEREVDAWLARCVAYHPRIELFKTLAFLRDSEQYET